MPIDNLVFRPSLMVVLHSRARGGVSARSVEIETKTNDDGSVTHKREVERTVRDAEELSSAGKTAALASGKIRSLCAKTALGLLLPIEREQDLRDAERDAAGIIADFNASARFTTLYLSVLTGRMDPDEARNVRAISDEVSRLVGELRTAIDAADPNAIRDAATRMKQFEVVLAEQQAADVKAAITEARKLAKAVTKKAEETSALTAKLFAKTLDTPMLDAVAARFQRIELDETMTEPAQATGDALPQADVQRASNIALDVEPTPDMTQAERAAAGPSVYPAQE